MLDKAKVKFFDGIADKWDGWEDLDLVAEKLAVGLDELGLGPDEVVLDVGCGTGNLTLALLEKLSDAGRVVAVDISPAMLAKAREKVRDSRVSWHVGDALRLPIANETFDRIICFSVWPHFTQLAAVTQELRRLLRPGGALHVWHTSSRATINAIHAKAGEAVANDVLEPAAATARLFEECGLAPYAIEDDDSRYLVSALKRPDA